jgi:tRNA (guanine-N7-)-methyltransferase
MSVFVPSDYFRELRRDEIFPDPSRPLEIDLGCGEGTFTAAMAPQFPERDFLAVERILCRVESTSKKIDRTGVENAKVMRLESTYVVGWLLPPACVSRLHLLCPDPWPKKRHERNRLVNNVEFLTGLERILIPGGEFLLKTDHPEYFENAIESLSQRSGFERMDWPEDAFFYPQTDFEKHWLRRGLSINRARWRKREA